MTNKKHLCFLLSQLHHLSLQLRQLPLSLELKLGGLLRCDKVRLTVGPLGILYMPLCAPQIVIQHLQQSNIMYPLSWPL